VPNPVAALDALARDSDATISVWMGGLDGQPWLSRAAEHVHPAASTMKLPLVTALLRAVDSAQLALDEEIPVRAVLPSRASGQTFETTRDYDNDDLPWERLHRTAPLGWLAERAIVRSSNLATNLLLDRIGVDAVNAVYTDAGATTARVERGIQDEPAMAAGLTNTVTAADLAAVVGAVARREIAEPDSCQRIEAILARCEHADAAAAGLPAGTYFAHKTGWFGGVCHDIGLVRPDGEPAFVLAILTGAPLDDARAHRLVADAAAICWEHRHDLAAVGASTEPA
jgi:beta-lactamase class A